MFGPYADPLRTSGRCPEGVVGRCRMVTARMAVGPRKQWRVPCPLPDSACGQNYRPTRRHSVCGRPFAFRHTSAETFLVDGVQWRCNGLRNAEFAEQDI
jgi:hypothetical protein